MELDDLQEISKDLPTGINGVMALMSKSKNTRLQQIIIGIVFVQAAIEVYKKAKKFIMPRVTYTISVTEDEDIFEDVALEFLSRIPDRKRKLMTAHMIRPKPSEVLYSDDDDEDVDEYYEDEDEADTKAKLIASLSHSHIGLSFGGENSQRLKLGGHTVTARIQSAQSAAKEAGESGAMTKQKDKLIFTARGRKGRQAVVDWLNEISMQKQVSVRVSHFWRPESSSYFRTMAIPKRELDTVVLKDGQVEEICKDIQTFLDNEKYYARLGIPYHRGFLFEGPPRTGKTSLVRALANHFNMDLYYVPLSDLEKDSSLSHLAHQMKPASILLLEDIDIFNAATSRVEKDKKVSMSGLLNVLDGMMTPHGMLIIMTTNHIENIDPAVIGPGRVDRIEHVGFLDQSQLERLFTIFYGSQKVKVPSLRDKEISPAAVIEIFKRNMNDASKCVADLAAHIQEMHS